MPNAANANMELVIGEESVFGTNPLTGTRANYTQVNLSPNSDSVDDDTIRSGRQPAGALRTITRGLGNIAARFSTRDYDSLIQTAFADAFSADVSNTGTFSSNTTTDEFTGTGIATGLVDGDGFFITGLGENDGFYTVNGTPPDNDTLPVRENIPSTLSGDADEEVHGEILNIGSTQRGLTVEKGSADATTAFYEEYNGCLVSTMTFTYRFDQLIEAAWDLRGQTPATSGATTFTTAVNAAANRTKLKALTPDLAQMREFDPQSLVDGACLFQSLTWTIDNRLDPVNAIVDGECELVLGTPTISGTIVAYAPDSRYIDRWIADQASTLSYVMRDNNASPDQYGVVMAVVRYGDVQAAVTQQTGPRTFTIPFTVEADANGRSLQFVRFLGA